MGILVRPAMHFFLPYNKVPGWLPIRQYFLLRKIRLFLFHTGHGKCISALFPFPLPHTEMETWCRWQIPYRYCLYLPDPSSGYIIYCWYGYLAKVCPASGTKALYNDSRAGKADVLLKRLFELSFGKYEWNFRQNGAEAAIRRGGTLKKAADFRDFCNKSHPVRLLKKQVWRIFKHSPPLFGSVPAYHPPSSCIFFMVKREKFPEKRHIFDFFQFFYKKAFEKSQERCILSASSKEIHDVRWKYQKWC